MLKIVPASSAQDLADIRILFGEYSGLVAEALCFQNFDEELEALPGKYAPPGGALLIARDAGTSNAAAAGCVALRPIDPATCEMKRMYVRESYRGTGLGRTLAVAVIAEARQRRHARIVLDTLPKLTTALMAKGYSAADVEKILGGNMLRPMRGSDKIAQALEADSIDQVTDAFARTFRAFADRTGSDRKALAACIRSGREPLTLAMLAKIACPALVAVGTEDVVGGPAEELAAVIPGAQPLPIPGRDHMLAVGDRVYKEGVLDFLRRRP